LVCLELLLKKELRSELDSLWYLVWILRNCLKQVKVLLRNDSDLVIVLLQTSQSDDNWESLEEQIADFISWTEKDKFACDAEQW